MRFVVPPLARRVIGRDFPLALLVAALLEVGSAVSLTDEDDDLLPLPDWSARLLLTAGALTLAFRRIAPLPVLALNGAADLSYQSLGYRPSPLPLGVLVALYTVAVARRPLIAGAATAAYTTILTVGMWTETIPADDDQVYVYLVSVAGTVMVAYGVALGHARATLAEEHAATVVREQDSRTLAAVRQEQARIARELHDRVANDVSVMVAQAAAAGRAVERRPQVAAAALESIETLGRSALVALRHLVGLLRTDDVPREPPPQTGLDRLPWLVTHLERAGLPVDLIIVGTARPLPATVEQNAFRIVQEALTNSLKHAGPTRATVTLNYTEESLGVEVRDQGQEGAESSTLGYGLINMRQRAAMLGGDLVVGPDDQGFRVRASLPVTDGAR
jgi:signal transduction histidine kinase